VRNGTIGGRIRAIAKAGKRASDMSGMLLSLQGISKRFPGVQALSDVRFDLQAGEVHALMGENGAGKSTLIKILCGVQPPDEGDIVLDGAPVTIASPVDAHAMGISSVHQELHFEPYLTVAENIFLGRQPTNRLGLIDHARLRREARKVLAELGVSIDVRALAGQLSIAERQVVAIARAVSMRARIMIFDEPTSSLTRRESALLMAMIRRLRDQSIGIMYVSHRMEEVFDLCDRVTVFRDGRYVATRDVGATSMAELVHMIVGRDLESPGAKVEAAAGPEVLEVRHLSKRGMLRDISFSLRRGEIVGLAGLVGAGRTELARVIFCDLLPDHGDVLVEGRPFRGRNPRNAIQAGIGFVPEDRKEQGLVTSLTVMSNISMARLGSLSWLGVVSSARERRLAREYVERLAIRTPSIEQKAMYLSGGNQQRVVVAKWLATQPKVLIVDEPTRGIDVGAKAEIHNLLRELAARGMAVLMISSDMPEILAVSDRVLVMHQGHMAGELPAATATQEAIMNYAMGLA
jgi:ribose transport system ATP-binding protein